MNTFRDIIACWPSIGDFAADIGVPYQAAQSMWWRDSIGVVHWPAVLRCLRGRGWPGLTNDDLVSMKLSRERAKRRAAAPAA